MPLSFSMTLVAASTGHVIDMTCAKQLGAACICALSATNLLYNDHCCFTGILWQGVCQ